VRPGPGQLVGLLTLAAARPPSWPGANRLAFLRIREEECADDDDSSVTRAEREVQMMNETVRVLAVGQVLALGLG
jgi:hypothetical protein